LSKSKVLIKWRNQLRWKSVEFKTANGIQENHLTAFWSTTKVVLLDYLGKN
jgi:hypothetical protein